MAGIMDMFKFGNQSAATPVPQVQQNTPAQPGNISATPPALAPTPGQGVVPNTDLSVQVSADTPKSPLDAFTDIWNTDKTNQVQSGPMFNVDPAELQKAAAKNDFSKIISQEVLQKIQGGGEGATQAMLSAMNSMSQSVYAQSAFATTKIVEQALERQAAAFEAKLPTLIKSQNVSDNLRSTNPIFNHPAASPILEVLKSQVALKYPNATSQEQMTMANDYLSSFAQAANPTPASSNVAKPGEVDWSAFLS